MASLFYKVARFARTRQGRRVIAEAKRLANDPHKRQQAKDAISKLRGKGGGTGGTGDTGPTGPTPPPSGH